MNANQVMRTIDTLHNRYNAENDIIPGAPSVTWTDYQLLEMIEALIHRIDGLEAELKRLRPSEEEQAGKSYAQYFYGVGGDA